MTDAGFFAEIAATPDVADPYLVYADALQLRGDPRGDLISIQHALETADWAIAADLRRREAALIEDNREAWLGPVLAHAPDLAIAWRFGFVHAARVTSASQLEAVMALPHAAETLVEIRIGVPGQTRTWPGYQDVIDALAWHPALRRLYITDLDLRGVTRAAPVALDARAQQLDTLVVGTRHLRLAWDDAPARLQTLALHTPHLEVRALRCAWPRLTSFVTWVADPRPLVPVLRTMPALRHLGLCGTTDTASLAPLLAKLPITSLDLRAGVKQATKRAFEKQLVPDVRFSTGATLDVLHDQQRAMWKRTTDTPEATYRKRLDGTLDRAWIDGLRLALARQMTDKRAQRDALAELVRDREASLDTQAVAGNPCYTLGELCDTLVWNHQAECWLWKAVAAARWRGAIENEIQALGLIATTRNRQGDPATAAVLMERVLAHYRSDGTESSLAWALRQRANIAFIASEFALADEHYREALTMYRRLGDARSEAIVLSELSGVLWSRQDFEGAAAMIQGSIAMREPGSFGLGSAYYNQGAILNAMNRHAESEEAARASLAIFRKFQRPDGEAQALSLLGELMQRTNRHAEAQPLLEEALALHRRRGAVRETGITLGNLAAIALDQGAFARGAALAEEAVEHHVACSNKYNEGMQRLDLADAAIGERRLEEATRLVEEALVPMTAIASAVAIAAAKIRRGFIAQLRGELAAAERHYEEAVADATRGNYPTMRGWTCLYRAVLRAQAQRPADAAALLAEARVILAGNVQGLGAAGTTEAVIARIGGATTLVPEPLGFDAHVIAMFAP